MLKHNPIKIVYSIRYIATTNSMKLLLTSLLFFIALEVSSQCNGSVELCNKKYNDVAYLTTHNSYSSSAAGFTFPNQNISITEQLNSGVRGFMLDVYDLMGTPTVYHGSFVLGAEPLSNSLGIFEQFLNTNPNEIITIIFECYVTANDIESEINTSGLNNYLFEKIPGIDWPTLQEMIDNNQRLIILTDKNDAAVSQGWYHYVWDHAVETHFSVNDPADFNNEFNRGDSLNDLFIFNHFITNAVLGTGNETASAIVNEYNFLMNRINENYLTTSKFPNFITLDFIDLGEGLNVVNTLNANILNTHDLNNNATLFLIHPNPASDFISISLPKNSVCSYDIVIYNQYGGKIIGFTDYTQKQLKINTTNYKDGIYYLGIDDGTSGMKITQLVIN